MHKSKKSQSLLQLTFLCIAVFFSLNTNAKIWTISDSKIDVCFDDQTALLSVTDKRCNKVWEQLPIDKKFKINGVSQANNLLSLKLYCNANFNATIELTANSNLVFGLSTESKKPFENCIFPSAFITPNKNHYILETDGEGMLLPADDNEYPLGNGRTFYCGGGLSMAWMGVTDFQFETGYMAILETPFDAALETYKNNNLITFRTVWNASMGEFGYERKVRFVFFEKGGYVAQCKKYREYIWEKNNVITIKENQRKFPAIKKMIGAVHIYVWDNARDVSFAKKLKQSGIEKAFILWDANHLPYPEMDYDSRLKELGYVSGIYDLYSDSHPNDSIANFTKNETNGAWLSRTSYPGLYKEITSRKKDGSVYINGFGHFVCPQAIRPEIIKRVEKELPVYPHEAYFLDVYQANGLYECYSDKHYLTREQYAREIIKNYKLLEDKYKTFVGGEWGADFMGSASMYNHGMMTLQRTWFGSDVSKKGTIYWNGDWSNNARPSQMLGTRVAPNKYMKYSINEYTRVPLYELVYHDAVVSSWRWEDGNHHCPEIWWKKDLFNILYGTAPLWSIDQERWEAYKNTFIESYQNICPWLQKIGYDEMVSHSFVTSDHKVQETFFSSGKRVVVNFGDSLFTFGNQKINPKSFLIFVD